MLHCAKKSHTPRVLLFLSWDSDLSSMIEFASFWTPLGCCIWPSCIILTLQITGKTCSAWESSSASPSFDLSRTGLLLPFLTSVHQQYLNCSKRRFTEYFRSLNIAYISVGHRPELFDFHDTVGRPSLPVRTHALC